MSHGAGPIKLGDARRAGEPPKTLCVAAPQPRARLLGWGYLGRRRGWWRQSHSLVFGASQRQPGVGQAGQVEARRLAETESGGEIAAGGATPGAETSDLDAPARLDPGAASKYGRRSRSRHSRRARTAK